MAKVVQRQPPRGDNDNFTALRFQAAHAAQKRNRAQTGLRTFFLHLPLQWITLHPTVSSEIPRLPTPVRSSNHLPPEIRQDVADGGAVVVGVAVSRHRSPHLSVAA